MEAKIAKRNRKWYALLFLLLLSIGSILGLLVGNVFQKENKVINARRLTKEKGYFIPLKIRGFSPADIPYLEINIENKTILAEMDLGYGGMVCLPANIIKELNKKKFIKRIEIRGLRGKTYENNLYEVEKVATNNMSFFPVKVEEKNLEFERDSQLVGEEDLSNSNIGTVGWYLFYSFNLFIDFQHSICALCDSLETLKQQGYPIDAFRETPLLLDRHHIEFEAITEMGPLRCVLDTGSTLNLLNKNIKNKCNDHVVFANKYIDYQYLNSENENSMNFDLKDVQEINSFKIGEEEFGPLTFNHIKSPTAVDAIVGMEFIDSTLIFIDFPNRKIYFFASPIERDAPQFAIKSDFLSLLKLLSARSRYSTYLCLFHRGQSNDTISLLTQNVTHLSLTPPFGCSTAIPVRKTLTQSVRTDFISDKTIPLSF